MGTPPLPPCAIQTGCAHRGGRLLIRMRAASPVVGRTSSPEEAALNTAQGSLHVKRQSFRVSCESRETSCVPQIAPQWDGRFSSEKRYIFRRSARPRRAPHLQLADVERLRRAKNEIWYQGSETPRSGRRVTRVVSLAARGALEHASSPPLSSTLCGLRAQANDAAQGQPGREGRR